MQSCSGCFRPHEVLQLAETPAYTFFCYIDALYAAENTIQGIDEDTVLGHHGVGIFWNICDWTIENQ